MNEPDDSREFREWLTETLRRQGWNKSDFARKVGVDSSLVSRWMQGRQPRPEKIRQIARRLGVDEDELLRKAGHRQASPAESPELADIMAKMKSARLNPERLRTLHILLEDWRQNGS